MVSGDDNRNPGERVYVIIPTHRELVHLRMLIADLLRQTRPVTEIIIINSAFGDATTRYLSKRDWVVPVTELRAEKTDYWAGAVLRGQKYLLNKCRESDYAQLLNSDVRVPVEFIEKQIEFLKELEPAVVSPVALSNGSPISNGCKMRSWMFGMYRHIVSAESDKVFEADMLAGRAIMFRAKCLGDAGTVNAQALPHYGSDYELTARFKKSGCRLWVSAKYSISVNTENTGFHASNEKLSISQRLRALGDIKSPLNLRYRVKFVKLVYPAYAVPSGLFFNTVRIMVQVLGGVASYRLFKPSRLPRNRIL